MPKTCRHENCSDPIWGKGYCKRHQYLRTDKSKPKGMKRVSDKRKEENEAWEQARKEHLAENPMCAFPGCKKEADSVHHKKGRIGALLTDKRYFVSLCWIPHHKWVEEHPREAKEMGLSFDRL